MTRRISARAGRLCAASLISALAVVVFAASAGATVIYNNLPAVNPGNVVSQAFEATQLGQFGGQVEFAGPNTVRTTVVVGMSSWACQTGTWHNNNCVTAKGAKFQWPVTLHIYDVGNANAVGTEIAKVTRTFKMPYRPSASAKCTGPSAGGWSFKGECLHGKYFRIRFMLKGVVLPSKAIISVSFNTSDYGTEPQKPKPCESEEAGCFYDSLNVGLTEPTKFNVKEEPEPVPPSVGSNPAPEDAYQDSTTAENYCDKGLQGTGTFRLDSGVPPCWSGFQPLFEVIAK